MKHLQSELGFPTFSINNYTTFLFLSPKMRLARKKKKNKEAPNVVYEYY